MAPVLRSNDRRESKMGEQEPITAPTGGQQQRSRTRYVVLAELEAQSDQFSLVTDEPIEAASADAAIRSYVESLDEPETLVPSSGYVAIPERSWVIRRVSVKRETKTTLA